MEDKGLAMRIMLPKETRDLEESHIEYGYYLNKAIQETNRINLQNYRKMRKHIKKFADDQASLLKNISENWSIISQRLDEKIYKKTQADRNSILAKIHADIATSHTSINLYITIENLPPLILPKK